MTSPLAYWLMSHYFDIIQFSTLTGVTKYYNVTNLPSSTRNRFFDCNGSLQSLSGVKTKLPGLTIKTSQLQQRLSRCTNHVLLFFFSLSIIPIIINNLFEKRWPVLNAHVVRRLLIFVMKGGGRREKPIPLLSLYRIIIEFVSYRKGIISLRNTQSRYLIGRQRNNEMY